MINIVLACQHGASTDLLVVKMREAAKAKGIEAVINAYAYTKLEQVIAGADIVLLGPQVRFKKKSLEAQFAKYQVPIEVIDTADYGMLNGEKVLQDAIESMKERGERL